MHDELTRLAGQWRARRRALLATLEAYTDLLLEDAGLRAREDDLAALVEEAAALETDLRRYEETAALVRWPGGMTPKAAASAAANNGGT